MSFIDDSIKNVKNSVLKEVSAVGAAVNMNLYD